MAKEDIIRGLEGAMSRGETLEKAMYSFYNAGYKKEDVESAATALSAHLSQQESLIPNVPAPKKMEIQKKPIEIKHPANLPKPIEIKTPIPLPKPVAKPVPIAKPVVKPAPVEIKKPTLQPIKQAQQKPLVLKQKVVQNVSSYEPARISRRLFWIIVLSITLGILLNVLAAILIFRESLLNFFNHIL